MEGGCRDGHGGDGYLYRLILITVFTVTLVCLEQTFVSSLPCLTLTSLRLIFNNVYLEGEFTIYQDFFIKITVKMQLVFFSAKICDNLPITIVFENSNIVIYHRSLKLFFKFFSSNCIILSTRKLFINQVYNYAQLRLSYFLFVCFFFL